jgi:hypothetical protein
MLTLKTASRQQTVIFQTFFPGPASPTQATPLSLSPSLFPYSSVCSTKNSKRCLQIKGLGAASRPVIAPSAIRLPVAASVCGPCHPSLYAIPN